MSMLQFNKNLSSQQLRLAESKLKFDLYQKRLALFMVLRDFASQVGLGNDQYDAGKFYRDTIERYFLFDADVYNYFDQIYRKANELTFAQMDFAHVRLDDNKREELIDQISGLKAWFLDQSDEMIKVFSNDLSMKALKQPAPQDIKSSYRQLSN